MTVNSLIVIPTAGKGSRTGLNYPKTLFEIDNKPILHHILERFENINADVVIIVSPKSHKLIKNSIKGFQRNIELIVQDLSLIHISSPRDGLLSRMPSSA